MVMAKVHVWHNISGKILAVGQAVGNRKCIAVPGENQLVLEIEVEESHISSLHKTHMIDVLRRSAVRLADARESRSKRDASDVSTAEQKSDKA